MEIVINIPVPTRRSYTVSGTTLAGVRAALERRPEWGEFGGRLTVDIPPRDPVTRATVICRPVITMPEWRERGAAPREAQAEWDRMHAALERHEAGHEAILRRLAQAFKTDTEALDPGPDRRALRRLARTLLRDHVAEQTRYDRQTAHGARDGVELRDP